MNSVQRSPALSAVAPPSRMGFASSSPHSIQSSRHAIIASATPKRSPKHLKYLKKLTREEVEEEYMLEWMEVSGMTIKRGPMNPFTIISFALGWIKYNIIPEVIRYAWWLVWVKVRVVLRQLQKKVILAGCRIDAALSRGQGFSVGEALRRWHGEVTVADILSYRFRLATTGKLPGHGVRAKGERPAAAAAPRPVAPRSGIEGDGGAPRTPAPAPAV